MGGVHMSCLGSKHELLQVADHVIAHYYQRVPFVRNHPQAIDLDMLVMELMGGSFMLYVDGDLFKVVLGFAQMEEEKEPLDEDKSGK